MPKSNTKAPINGRSLLHTLFARLRTAEKVFEWVKHAADDRQFAAIRSAVATQSHPFHALVFAVPFPRTYNEMWNLEPYATAPLTAEIRWAASSIARFGNAISKFNIYRADVERLTLFGNYAGAKVELQRIEAEFGMSVFVIQYRLLIAELEHGLSANALELSSIEKSGCAAVVRVLAAYLSMRVERNVSPDNFQRRLENDLAGLNDLPGHRAFFESRLSVLTFADTAHAHFALNIQSPGSICDRYLQFVSVCRLLVAVGSIDTGSLAPVLSTIQQKVNDPQLENILRYYDESRPVLPDELTRETLVALDLFVVGKFAASAVAARAQLVKEPRAFFLYELYFNSLALSGNAMTTEGSPDSFFNVILRSLQTIYFEPEQSLIAAEMLRKIALCMGDSPLSFGIHSFLSKHVLWNRDHHSEVLFELASPIVIPTPARGCRDLNSNPVLAAQFQSAFTHSAYLHALCECHAAIQANRAPNFQANVSPVLAIQWAGFIAREQHKFREFATRLTSLRKLLGNGPATAEEFFNDEISEGLIFAAIQEGQLSEAIEQAVETLLSRPWAAKRLPIDVLIRELEGSPTGIDGKNINVPVLYGLSDQEPKLVYVAYDNFMSAVGFTRPTSMFSVAHEFESRRFASFIYRVCTPTVLSRSYHFIGTDDLDGERLRLCQYLSVADPLRTKVYSAEINAITERTMIRLGMQQIEESKIYVDEVGIRSRGKKLFLELYERLRAFAAVGNANPELQLTDATRLVSYFETNDSGKLVQKPIPELGVAGDVSTIVHVAHLSHFRDFFLEVRDRFISSSEHGLDAYLSTRIRHGTLEGQVRSIFERLNLMAQRDKTSGEYLDVLYWSGRLGPEEELLWKQIQCLLATFSRKIDNVIDFLKRNVVRIATERRQDGLLNFAFSDSELIQMLVGPFSSLDTYDEFIDETFRVLWRRTNDVLADTRRRLLEDIKADVYQALIALVSAVRKIIRAEVAPELHAHLTRGLTNLQTEFDRIAKWFTVSHSALISTFTMADLVRISAASVANIYPARRFAPEIIIRGDVNYDGHYFAHFSDIYRTLFDNAIMRSGLCDADSNVRVVIEVCDKMLLIRVQNALSGEVRSQDPVSVLRNKQATCGPDPVSPLVKTEGGSGLAKIQKIMWSDLGRQHATLTFDYTPAGWFEVIVSMEVDGLLSTNECATN